MVDRLLKNDILDILRKKNFRTVKEIAAAKGIDVETTKEAVKELIADKLVFYNEL